MSSCNTPKKGDPNSQLKKYTYKKPKPIITKHDKELCGRYNTHYLDKHCPPNGDLGDLVHDEIELDGRVMNSLRQKLDRMYY